MRDLKVGVKQLLETSDSDADSVRLVPLVCGNRGRSVFCMPGMAKPWLLLLASVGFYSCFNKFAFFFIGGSALSIWLGGLLLDGRRPSVQKLVLTSVLALNIGILLASKYLG